MPPYKWPWQRLCDCSCIVHYLTTRVTYDEPGCACTITCATQPLTLLADLWDCALFLDSRGDLWHVPVLAPGVWDWNSAAEIDTRSELYNASVVIRHLLQASLHLLATTDH